MAVAQAELTERDAITFGAKAEDLMNLDLAYSPPFSTTKDPVMYTGMILHKGITNHD